MLEALVDAAIRDASADDVTPQLADGSAWTPSRIAWLRTFHCDRRAGLSGTAGEITWAVVVDGCVVGSVRLKCTTEAGVLETGIWLTHGARGHGVGSRVMAEVLQRAVALGARGVRADTTAGNASALKMLHRLGFDLTPTDSHQQVRALLRLELHVS